MIPCNWSCMPLQSYLSNSCHPSSILYATLKSNSKQAFYTFHYYKCRPISTLHPDFDSFQKIGNMDICLDIWISGYVLLLNLSLNILCFWLKTRPWTIAVPRDSTIIVILWWSFYPKSESKSASFVPNSEPDLNITWCHQTNKGTSKTKITWSIYNNSQRSTIYFLFLVNIA